MPETKSNVHEKLKQRQFQQKYYHDVGSRSLKTLSPGDVVRMRLNNKWQPATVESKSDEIPRTYNVKTPQGKVFRRNRRDLVRTMEQLQEDDVQVPVDENIPEDNAPIQAPSMPHKPAIACATPAKVTLNPNSSNPNFCQCSQKKPTAHTQPKSGRIVIEPIKFKDFVK
jgi:hypothetical protein